MNMDKIENEKSRNRVISDIILWTVAILLISLLIFSVCYRFVGKVTVEIDGVEQQLSDATAVARAIQDPEIMSEFGFRMAVFRLSNSERAAIMLDYEHLPLESLPYEMKKRIKIVKLD